MPGNCILRVVYANCGEFPLGDGAFATDVDSSLGSAMIGMLCGYRCCTNVGIVLLVLWGVVILLPAWVLTEHRLWVYV